MCSGAVTLCLGAGMVRSSSGIRKLLSILLQTLNCSFDLLGHVYPGHSALQWVPDKAALLSIGKRLCIISFKGGIDKNAQEGRSKL